MGLVLRRSNGAGSSGPVQQVPAVRSVHCLATSLRHGRTDLKSSALFSFIGAVPRTEWLPPEIEKDARGFVETDSLVALGTQSLAGYPAQRGKGVRNLFVTKEL